MAEPPDRVQVLKRESAALGGDAADEQPWDAPIEPQEDGIEVAGVWFQDASNRDEDVLAWREGNDLKFKDKSIPAGKTLTELAASGGLTEEQHKALRQLIHFISEGPAEGFASGAYKETLPSGNPFPTSAIWYNESGESKKKIVELLVTYNADKTHATETWKMYDAAEVLLVTVTDTISYSGVFETSRTRTIA